MACFTLAVCRQRYTWPQEANCACACPWVADLCVCCQTASISSDSNSMLRPASPQDNALARVHPPSSCWEPVFKLPAQTRRQLGAPWLLKLLYKFSAVARCDMPAVLPSIRGSERNVGMLIRNAHTAWLGCLNVGEMSIIEGGYIDGTLTIFVSADCLCHASGGRLLPRRAVTVAVTIHTFEGVACQRRGHSADVNRTPRADRALRRRSLTSNWNGAGTPCLNPRHGVGSQTADSVSTKDRANNGSLISDD